MTPREFHRFFRRGGGRVPKSYFGKDPLDHTGWTPSPMLTSLVELDGWVWSPSFDLPNSKNSEADLVKVSAVVQKAVVLVLLSARVLMS